MNRDDRVTYVVGVPAGELLYPCVYEPAEMPMHRGYPDPRSWYSVTVAEGLVRDAGMDTVALGTTTRKVKDRDGQFVNLKSHWRPEVEPVWADPRRHGKAVDRLVTELARLDARNLDRSRALMDRYVEALVQVFPYDNAHVGPGNFLALVGIKVYMQ